MMDETINVTIGEEPIVVNVEITAAGPPGVDGAAGVDGTDGQGVPVGGSVGQVLTKKSGSPFDTSWQDSATGGGGGVWEPVETLNVTGAAVQEMLFGAITPLDFLKYEYRLEGLLKTEGNNTETVVWYAAETNAAAVVAADYVGSIFMGISYLADVQTRDNSFLYHSGVYFPSVFEFAARIFATTEGRTILSCEGVDIRDPTNTSNESSAGIMFRNVSWNSQSKVLATHFGVYNSAGAFIGAGTSMTLSRRTL